jgi:hypothetical protein
MHHGASDSKTRTVRDPELIAPGPHAKALTFDTAVKLGSEPAAPPAPTGRRMIPRNASPIGHVSPRPPIEINPRHPVTADIGPPSQRLSQAECARIWSLVKGAAEGSNVAAAPRPEVCDESGWEVA